MDTKQFQDSNADHPNYTTNSAAILNTDTCLAPPFLKDHARIGMVCPAGYIPLDKVQNCLKAFEEGGYTIIPGKTIGHQYHYFSGTDEERLEDLQTMLDDDTIDAILFGRGGYGVSRIIDRINFDKFVQKSKWLIGFSDITVLHAHIHQRYGIQTIHAPMAAAFNDALQPNPFTQSLFNVLRGEAIRYTTATYPLNKKGEASGILIGGNLAMIAHLVGSVSAYQTEGKILFIEDVGEYLYNIDRMLYQLNRSGALQHLAGLIVGGFTDMKDTTTPFGASIEDIVYRHIKDYNYPVCFHFPVSHATENYALIVGANYRLTVTDTVRLESI